MAARTRLLVALLAAACADEDAADFGEPQRDFVIPDPPPVAICPGDSEAHAVMNAYWYAFDRWYGAFDTRLPNGDWHALGEAACADIHAGMSDDALYDVLIALARNFDDGHTELTAPSLRRDEDAWVHAYPYYEQLYELEYDAEDRYVDGDLRWTAQDWIGWGSIGDIGYVSITAMEAYVGDGDDEAADVHAAGEAMARVMDDLRDKQGIVVDARANEGGWDTVSLEIAAWFAGGRTLAWADRRRNGPGHEDFTPWLDAFVDAARPGAYEGPVILLTSGGTFSAGDTFVLAMRGRDRVTLMGEPSSGHFSDQLGGVLPNGWWLVLSGEQYRADDGIDYETQGVPVDVPFAFDPDALAHGHDTMLEVAIAMLR